MPQTISIISDWKKQDYYLSAVKQKLYDYVPDVKVSEISNQIESFEIMQAAFILSASWKFFPKNSIHLFCINSEASEETPHVLIKHKDHFFIGADHGYWEFICGEKPDNIYIINNEKHYEGNEFPELNIFVPVAASVIKGAKPAELGEKTKKINIAPEINPVLTESSIEGNFIYFDSYGNGITNINENLFNEKIKNRNYIISIVSEKNQIKNISAAYSDVKKGELCAIFNSLNLLEISIREGNLKQLLNLRDNDDIRIEIKV